MLTGEQRQTLLALARASIEGRIADPAMTVEAVAVDWPEASGVFVTIKRRGQLRGCLGTLQNRAGLAAEVTRCAADSATADLTFFWRVSRNGKAPTAETMNVTDTWVKRDGRWQLASRKAR